MEIDAGDVVWGFWPYDGEGGKNRPLLVLWRNKDTGMLEVAYGSSQHVVEIKDGESDNPKEFLVTNRQDMVLTGLNRPTRFNLGDRMQISPEKVEAIGHVRTRNMLYRLERAVKAAHIILE
ncbi:hypothetical protein RU820_05430 [Acidithiobacillus ferrooxidans]|uniref:hypothetical protein n=1 Tax=Acidithiobacillus ferrooxidans TaxID=920 RepID=UPI0011D04B1D|nr:hypothetical protein [Acidithiobacillus ferrooxidans]